MDFIIRKYTRADCNEIVNLFYNTVHIINKKDYSKEQLDAWTSKPLDLLDLNRWNNILTNHYTLVAVKDNIIVGFGDIDKTGYLDHLYVHYNYQGQGIATKICDQLENYTNKDISVHASISAKDFFIKRGYKIIKEQQVKRNNVFLKNFVMIKQRNYKA